MRGRRKRLSWQILWCESARNWRCNHFQDWGWFGLADPGWELSPEPWRFDPGQAGLRRCSRILRHSPFPSASPLAGGWQGGCRAASRVCGATTRMCLFRHYYREHQNIRLTAALSYAPLSCAQKDNMRSFRILVASLWFLFPIFLPSLHGATVTWVGGSGDWNTTANWSTGALPGTGDDAVVGPGPAITVTHSTGAHTVRSVQSQQAFMLSGGDR